MGQSYEVEGKVKLVTETQVFGSGFEKKQLVVTTEDGKYPQDICIDFPGDKIGLLDEVCAGDEVCVRINIRGNEYKGRYFNTLSGWKINVLSESEKGSRGAPPPPPEEDPGADIPEDDEFDDVPY